MFYWPQINKGKWQAKNRKACEGEDISHDGTCCDPYPGCMHLINSH